jgi:hypothetical protein
MSSAQARLSDYLQYELYHSIGAYGIARERLAKLERRLEKARGDAGETAGPEESLEQDDLLRVTRIARRYNDKLALERHAAQIVTTHDARHALRHPIPDQLPLSLRARFDIEDGTSGVKDARLNPWASPVAWAWVVNFYEAAIFALSPKAAIRDGCRDNPRALRLATTFARNITWPRDRLFRPPASEQAEKIARREARDRRRTRFEERCERAATRLPGQLHQRQPRAGGAADFLHWIATDNLTSGSGSLPLFVINALAEAHLSMHAVEAWQSMSLGAHAERVSERDWLASELDRCIELNTFAYCASRCAPWIFAEDEAEGTGVFENFEAAWKNAVPTRCMWIAAQVSLLALHRRAYSHALRGERTKAYNDYHKLQQQIRDTRRRIDSAPVHIAGAVEFLAGLDAQANQNIGELYRAEHAQQPALKHFQTALERLEAVRDQGEMDEVLTNSRWFVELQISQGKASYEMGKHKDSLRWHLQGWRAYLKLLAAETQTEASTDAIDRATAWLDQIRFEPELRKHEVQRYLKPVVEQLDRITVNARLGALAAEILLRLGHVLFVLNLGLEDTARSTRARDDTKEQRKQRIADTLAFGCLRKAAECDRHSTLVSADLLKARYRFADWFHRDEQDFPQRYKNALNPPEMAPIADHWPRGGDDYERIARVAEYLMLRARLHPDAIHTRKEGSRDERDDVKVATDLLLNFFMHTESINVRKAQVHRFLMKESTAGDPPAEAPIPAIELVCMRRYSSAFPLLPRPSAFRAHGGGYFVRLHAESHVDPFGIVVDPGFDFIENLYRTGFSLSDIRMIIVTHDHVDHLSSLESLLSLLHYRSGLLVDQAKGDPHAKDDEDADVSEEPLPVYGNAAVYDRYQSVATLTPHFRRLDKGVVLPKAFKNFEIVAMSSAAVDGTGHIDLSGKPSYGIHFSHPRTNISLAITSDTPAPPTGPRATQEQLDRWHATWRPALEADVLVVHLSTVPLTELRQIAGLDARHGLPRSADAEHLSRLILEALARSNSAIERLRRMKQDEVESRLSAIEAQHKKRTSFLDDHEYMDLAGELCRIEQLQAKVETLRAAFEELGRAVADLRSELPPHSARRKRLKKATRRCRDAAMDVEVEGRLLDERLRDIEHRPVLCDRVARLVLDARTLALAAQSLPREAEDLERIRGQLETGTDLRGQIEFGLWLRSHQPGPTAGVVGRVPSDPDDVTRDWKPPRDHPYLQGTLSWARAYREARKRLLRDAADQAWPRGALRARRAERGAGDRAREDRRAPQRDRLQAGTTLEEAGIDRRAAERADVRRRAAGVRRSRRGRAASRAVPSAGEAAADRVREGALHDMPHRYRSRAQGALPPRRPHLRSVRQRRERGDLLQLRRARPGQSARAAVPRAARALRRVWPLSGRARQARAARDAARAESIADRPGSSASASSPRSRIARIARARRGLSSAARNHWARWPWKRIRSNGSIASIERAAKRRCSCDWTSRKR